VATYAQTHGQGLSPFSHMRRICTGVVFSIDSAGATNQHHAPHANTKHGIMTRLLLYYYSDIVFFFVVISCTSFISHNSFLLLG
jgi:hypothetical protein